MEYRSGNIFIREMRLDAEGVINGHAHNFDHTTYIAHGSIKIEKLDADGNVVKTVVKKASDGYNWVLIESGVIHRITGLEDGTVAHCIYSHRNPQAEIVQDYDGWSPAYR